MERSALGIFFKSEESGVRSQELWKMFYCIVLLIEKYILHSEHNSAFRIPNSELNHSPSGIV